MNVAAWRRVQLARFEQDPKLVASAKAYYSTRPVEFIMHWCDTYDPRHAGSANKLVRMPFVLFQRQVDLVDFLDALIGGEQSGLVEKCRDMGATWVCAAYSVWLWIFKPGAAVGWGSRKADLVDTIGDPKSIFEKIRMLIRWLPGVFKPAGLRDDHLAFMKVINPENDATISGESGDNIGRGGRTLIYFKDESAHYERPEKIEAALADNTRVQVDISSVNGLGNVFHRKREGGVLWTPNTEAVGGTTNVFIMDWRDHPEKTQEWYNERKQKAESEGLAHIFAQEVDRNYSAAVQGVVIPADWVAAAIDAHKVIPGLDEGAWCGALDVADEGEDRNALATRKGVVLRKIEEWGERDTGATARHTVAACEGLGDFDLYYDCIGVGAGVKAETNRLKDEGLMPRGMFLIPWDAGASPLHPDQNVIPGDKQSPLNRDFYANLKAQGWWMLRRRFEKTWRAVNHGEVYSPDELISLSSDMPLLRQLQKELSQPTAGRSSRLKLLINKTPKGTRSPNLADAAMMCFWPVETRRPMKISLEAMRLAAGRR